jgi:ketosteroid isomerase-like protein
MAVTLPEIIRSYIDAYNRKDVTALMACVANDIVFENVSNSGPSMKIEGRTAFAELAEQAATMFTARHQTITNAVVDGGRVALEVDWTGTPAVNLGSIKAGEPIVMRGASFMTVTEGLLTRIVDLS